MLKLITTFSKEGYELYGKRWINSVLKYWPSDTQIIVYVDFDLLPPAENFTIKNFENEFPDHQEFKKFIKSYYINSNKEIEVGNKTIKFSFKGFVIDNELSITTEKILVWLDGDVETTDYVSTTMFDDMLKGTFLACQQEKNNKHTESGILVFDTSHNLASSFSKEFKNYYRNKQLTSIKKPYDGYIISTILKNQKYNYIDLNAGFNVTDKKSTKEDTFLHPILKSHFIHWIGIGKI